MQNLFFKGGTQCVFSILQVFNCLFVYVIDYFTPQDLKQEDKETRMFNVCQSNGILAIIPVE